MRDDLKHIIAAVGTIICLVLLFLLLWFLHISNPPLPEETIEITLVSEDELEEEDTMEQPSGRVNNIPSNQPAQTPPKGGGTVNATPPSNEPSEEIDNEEPEETPEPVVPPKQTPDPKPIPNPFDSIDWKQPADEPEVKSPDNPISSGFINGDGSNGGDAWSLEGSGRSIVGGLGKPKIENGDATGTVTIGFNVDAQGNVTKAWYKSGTGSIITDKAAHESCIAQAGQLQFSQPQDDKYKNKITEGEITYHIVSKQ